MKNVGCDYWLSVRAVKDRQTADCRATERRWNRGALNQETGLSSFGLTENDGHENDGPSKLQDMKLQDMNLRDIKTQCMK